jgi:hypothetical protein
MLTAQTIANSIAAGRNQGEPNVYIYKIANLLNLETNVLRLSRLSQSQWVRDYKGIAQGK